MNREYEMPSGRPKKVSDAEILRVMREHPDKAVTATEIAEEIGITSTGLLNRLNELAEGGYVHKKRAGANAVVWWPENQR